MMGQPACCYFATSERESWVQIIWASESWYRRSVSILRKRGVVYVSQGPVRPEHLCAAGPGPTIGPLRL